VHTEPPFKPAEPALHLQLASVALALRELVLAGHSTHCVSAVAPAPTRYLPASHDLHAIEPAVSSYFPATHSAHAGPPFTPAEPATHLQSLCATVACAELVRSGHAVQPVSAVPPS